MGIVKQKLAEFELSTGQSVDIEHNENRIIHLHVDNVLFGFTEEEFLAFADATEQALEDLEETKDL